MENKIKGGKGDKTNPKSLDKKEFSIGSEVEKEHTDDKDAAKEIATDHLSEDPKYYSKLINADLVDEPSALKKVREIKVIIKSIKSQLLEKNIIKEELTRSDIELIKRLILSAFEGWLQNLFTRRSLTLTGINWKENFNKEANLINEALKKSELTDLEDATHLGGIHKKYIGKDKSGKKYMSKPSDLPFGPWADYAASKISKAIHPDYPKTRVRDLDGEISSEQEMLNAQQFRPGNPSELSKEDLTTIIQDGVLNWMLGNHDANFKQFIRNDNGRLIGIDKTQSFKFYERDKLDINYQPNNSRPYIYIVLEAWRDGKIELNKKDFIDAIKKIQSIPDDRLKQWVHPYAIEVEKKFRKPKNETIMSILKRKHNLLHDYMEFLSRVMNKNIDLNEALKPTNLKNIENAKYLGGAFPKYVGESPDGSRKLLKPHRETFRAEADRVASKIGKQINPDTPNVKIVDFEGDAASEQDFLDTDNSFQIQKWSGAGVKSLSQNEINSIIQDSVLNWMIGNHDAHAAQFIRTKSGNVVGIDKTQAFKHYGRDKLDINFHPNENFGEDRPYIYYILEAWKNGEIEIDPKQFGIAIKKIQMIPDWELTKWVIPYAKEISLAFKGGDRNWIREFVGMVIERKHNLFRDYTKFLSDLMSKDVQLERNLKKE